MALADFNYADFDPSAQAEQDKTLLVKFYYKNVQDQSASRKEGRPIFKEKVYIDIKLPGSRDGAARPATARDIERFQPHYAAFKARVEMPTVGTPLSEWSQVPRSMVEEMSFMNIKTVEQLAELNDGLAGRFMGALNLKAKAQKFLEQSKENLTVETLQHALEDRDQKLADMQSQLDELKASLAAAPKRRKSRAKPKAMPIEGDPIEEAPQED